MVLCQCLAVGRIAQLLALLTAWGAGWYGMQVELRKYFSFDVLPLGDLNPCLLRERRINSLKGRKEYGYRVHGAQACAGSVTSPVL